LKQGNLELGTGLACGIRRIRNERKRPGYRIKNSKVDGYKNKNNGEIYISERKGSPPPPTTQTQKPLLQEREMTYPREKKAEKAVVNFSRKKRNASR